MDTPKITPCLNPPSSLCLCTYPKSICTYVEEMISQHLPKNTLILPNFCIQYPNVTFFDALETSFSQFLLFKLFFLQTSDSVMLLSTFFLAQEVTTKEYISGISEDYV